MCDENTLTTIDLTWKQKLHSVTFFSQICLSTGTNDISHCHNLNYFKQCSLRFAQQLTKNLLMTNHIITCRCQQQGVCLWHIENFLSARYQKNLYHSFFECLGRGKLLYYSHRCSLEVQTLTSLPPLPSPTYKHTEQTSTVPAVKNAIALSFHFCMFFFQCCIYNMANYNIPTASNTTNLLVSTKQPPSFRPNFPVNILSTCLFFSSTYE